MRSMTATPSVQALHPACVCIRQARPLFASKVEAGFPSPAEGLLEETLDLNAYLIRNPSATFLVRVAGESMTGAGIFSDDILVVDRSEEPREGAVVVAVVDNEFTVKRFARRAGRIELRAENPAYPPIRLSDESELSIWGVVRHVIHAV